jgi:Ca-activated chloride channel family protein
MRWMFGMCAAAALSAAVLAAQTVTNQPARDVFRSGIEVVSLNVTVRDRTNRGVPDLSAADFSVFENGARQEIVEVSRRRLPLSLSFLVDTSGSMYNKLDMAEAAAMEFVRQLGPSDKAAVIAFDHRVQVLQPLTSDQANLERAIRSIVLGGATALFNAIYIALKDLEGVRALRLEDIRRQAIVVLSDGDDTASLVPFEDVRELAARSHTAIYAIGIHPRDRPGAPQSSEGDFVLRRLAQQTGGMAFFPQSADELSRIYHDVAEELTTQYFVAYVPTNTQRDGKWRTVNVRVERPNCAVRTRSGYFAPAR